MLYAITLHGRSIKLRSIMPFSYNKFSWNNNYRVIDSICNDNQSLNHTIGQKITKRLISLSSAFEHRILLHSHQSDHLQWLDEYLSLTAGNNAGYE